MRLLVVVAAVFSFTAGAVDYRDCRELYVSPLTAQVPDRKASGAPWDNGSVVDVRISAMVSDRADSYATIGPVKTDVAKPAWNQLVLNDKSVGAWLPARVGDTLSVHVTDQDPFADDAIDSFTIDVPKTMADSGIAFLVGKGKAATVSLRIAASDGRRTCKGIEGEAPLKYEIPNGIVALPDDAAFAELSKYSRCNLNRGSDACRRESYRAAYADLNEDTTPDMIVAGGPFGGGTTAVMLASLGYAAESRTVLFLGECADLKPHKDEKALLCTDGERTTRIPFDGKPVREATQLEVEESTNALATKRAEEAKVTLKAIYASQRTYFAEKDAYSPNFEPLHALPARGNRYAYFLAPRGVTQRRDGSFPQPFAVIVGPDQERFKDAVLPAGLKEAGCPLTFGTSADGEPIGLGLTGIGKDQQFIGYAIGNIDDDPDYDCWSIATFERKSKDGRAIPAGEPFNEKSDLGKGSVVGVVKTMKGTVVETQAGDLGCYVSLQSDDGQKQTYLADFDVCGEGPDAKGSFLKQRVSVSVASRRIEICEGGPQGCGHFEDRMTIVEITKL